MPSNTCWSSRDAVNIGNDSSRPVPFALPRWSFPADADDPLRRRHRQEDLLEQREITVFGADTIDTTATNANSGVRRSMRNT